jgi:glycosyltransferase involved in cell wall biosynthesis
MNIWIVSLYDPTVVDNTRPMRFMSLATEAEVLGHDITYFSNTFRHATKKNRVDNANTIVSSSNYRTIFVDSMPYIDNISLERFLSHYLFAKNLLKKINEVSEKPDVIVSAMPPIFVNVYLSKWAKKNNVKFYLDIIDPWPDVFKNFLPNYIRPFSDLLFLPYRKLIQNVINRSNGVLSISNQYLEWAKKYLIKKNLNFHLAYPSIDFEAYQMKLLKYHNKFLNRPLTIIYAGNLGHSYDIPCILKAARLLDEKYPGKTHFIIAGLGYFESEINEYILKYSNLKYLGRINHEALMQNYANADLGLAQYRHRATQSVTYKLFDYLGSGLPILNSLMSEMALIIEGNNLGFNNKPGDFKMLASNIELFFNSSKLDEYKKNAINFTKQYGSNKIVYTKYIEFLIRQ